MESKKSKYVVILAAGKGTRMNSELPKVLMEVDQKPMIFHVLENVIPIQPNEIYIVVGYKKEIVIDHIQQFIQKDNIFIPIQFVEQNEQLGTGHAFMMTEPFLKDKNGYVLVTAGDMPLISTKSFEKLFQIIEKENTEGSVLTSIVENPYGYGRIIRDKNHFISKIIEEKDASEDIKKIKEINTGCYVFTLPEVFSLLKLVKNNNKQGEYYLPDIIEIYRNQNRYFSCLLLENSYEALGANSKEELQMINEIYKIYKSNKGNVV